MDITTLIPKQFLPGYLWFSKHLQHFKYNVDPDGITFSLKLPPQDHTISTSDYLAFKRLVEALKGVRSINQQTVGGKKVSISSELFALYLHSRLLGEGVKCFYPTDQQCEAMLNVELNIPFGMYRQPFPVLAVRLPTSFVARHANLTKTRRFPHTAVVGALPPGDQIIVVSAQFSQHDGMINIVANRPKYATLEDALNKRACVVGEVEDYETAQKVQRLAMNFCMMLTQYRHRLKPYSPESLESARRLLDSKDRDKRRRGEMKLATQTEVVEFEQEVQFYDQQERGPKDGAQGHHASPHPHWRKGHWRREAGYREILTSGGTPKILFVRPTFVNPSLFCGDLSNTAADYISHNPNTHNESAHEG